MFYQTPQSTNLSQVITKKSPDVLRISLPTSQTLRPQPIFIGRLGFEYGPLGQNTRKITCEYYKKSHVRIINRCYVDWHHLKGRGIDSKVGKLKLLAKKFKFLRYLHVNLHIQDYKDTVAITTFLISLRPINTLSGLFLNYPNHYVHKPNEADVQMLSLSVKHLRTLSKFGWNLYGCDQVTDNNMKRLSLSLKYLENLSILDLNLGMCTEISSKGLQDLLISLRHLNPLQNLTLDLTDGKDLNGLFKALKYLTPLTYLSLNLSHSPKVTDQQMGVLVESLKPLTGLSRLHIDFTCCFQISDFGIKTLAGGLKPLTSLSILKLTFNNCGRVSHRGIREIFSSACDYLSLSILTLVFHSVNKITQEGLISLCTNLRDVRGLSVLELSFGGLQLSMEEGVGDLKAVVEKNRSLSRVTINGKEILSRKGLNRLMGMSRLSRR